MEAKKAMAEAERIDLNEGMMEIVMLVFVPDERL